MLEDRERLERAYRERVDAYEGVDDDFRDRCTRELADLNAQGRTVVFMSHDLELVRSICSTGMWLDRGRARLLGGIDEVAAAYERATHESVTSP